MRGFSSLSAEIFVYSFPHFLPHASNTSHKGDIGLPVSFSASRVEPKSTSSLPASVSVSRASNLVVRAGLAVVADELHATDHLADGEETNTLGEDDAAGCELRGAEVASLVKEVLGGAEDGAVLDGFPEVLVVGLDGGDGAGGLMLTH